MKGKIKKIIVTGLSALMILSVGTLAACSKNMTANDQIEILQEQITELRNKIDEKNDKIKELEEQIKQISSKNEETTINPENYEIVVETTLYDCVDNCKDFIAICNSFDEFKDVCLSNGYNFFDSGNQNNNYFNTTVGEELRGYSDEYFKDKAFVVCAFYKNAWSGQYLIEEVRVTAEKLTLYIKYPRNNTADDVENSIFLIAGVDKSLVSGVTDIEYVLR